MPRASRSWRACMSISAAVCPRSVAARSDTASCSGSAPDAGAATPSPFHRTTARMDPCVPMRPPLECVRVRESRVRRPRGRAAHRLRPRFPYTQGPVLGPDRRRSGARRAARLAGPQPGPRLARHHPRRDRLALRPAAEAGRRPAGLLRDPRVDHQPAPGQQRRPARDPHPALVHDHVPDRGRHRPRDRPDHQPGLRHRPHAEGRRALRDQGQLDRLPDRHRPGQRDHAVHRAERAADRVHGRRQPASPPSSSATGPSRSSPSASRSWSCSRRPCGGSSASPRSAPSASSATPSPTTAGTSSASTRRSPPTSTSAAPW